MFYTFTIKIKEGKTFKNVTDTVRDSFIEREIHDIKIQGNYITGKDDLIKLDFSSRYPTTISPGKEHFIYDENMRTLTLKSEHFIRFYLI